MTGGAGAIKGSLVGGIEKGGCAGGRSAILQGVMSMALADQMTFEEGLSYCGGPMKLLGGAPCPNRKQQGLSSNPKGSTAVCFCAPVQDQRAGTE